MARPPDLETRTREWLAGLDAHALRRRLQPPAGIDFCSNDYLGLSAHPVIAQRMAEAVTREGAGATGSRLLRGERECFADLERRFAAFKGTERALYFSSGYLANVGVLATFAREGDVLFSDELNHASLVDGVRLSKARRRIYPHSNVRALQDMLESENGPGQKFLVTESVFSMDGDVAPLEEYARLCRATNTALVIDEAHAVGVFGARGSGLIEERGIENDVFISINPCGKALGVAGAVVCGPEWAIEYLVQRARTFIYSTAPSPSVAAGLDAALSIIESDPARRVLLHERVQRLRTLLGAERVDVAPGTSPIIPIMIGDNARALEAAASLQADGFDVRAIRPPTVPEGTARLRVTVNIGLDDTTLRRFVERVATVLAEGRAVRA